MRDLIDLSAAFDTLYYTILLKTNSRLSLGLRPRLSTGSDPTCAVVNSINWRRHSVLPSPPPPPPSFLRLLEYGVRQGSVLVPVLFICMLSRYPLLSMRMVVMIINTLMTYNCHKALLPRSFSLPNWHETYMESLLFWVNGNRSSLTAIRPRSCLWVQHHASAWLAISSRALGETKLQQLRSPRITPR